MGAFWYFVLFIIVAIILIIVLPAAILHEILAFLASLIGWVASALITHLEAASK